MFFQYRSNSLLQLSQTFSLNISERKPENPFDKNWIVVQNKEAQQWLTLQDAYHSRIAANFEFILPLELIWKLYRNFYPETPKVLPGDRIPLQWIIFEFLMESEPEDFERVKGFPEVKNEMQAYRLSVQLADVFDLYQVYRPDMTEAWKSGILSSKNEQESWQLWIWRAIQDRISVNKGASDRGFVFNHLLEAIQNAEIQGNLLPGEIHCFGLSQFSKPFARLISELSKKTDIHFYSSTIESNSGDLFSAGWESLKSEWGKPKYNSEGLIRHFLNEDELKINEISKERTENIFLKAQRHQDSDSLIEIHSCHSARREVEVLKDMLLARFDSDSNLKAEDVLIMVPDMEEYAPLIQSIFTFNEGEPALPVYTPNTSSKHDVLAFTKLLELIGGAVKVNDFLDFLELEVIRERFVFTEDELGIIRRWIAYNNTYWGLDESDSSFSLKKLSRALISGYVTEPNAFESFQEFIPFDSVSTKDHFELSAKLSFMVEELIKIRAQLTIPRKPKLWVDFFYETSVALFNPGISPLLATLDKLREACLVSKVNKKISYSVIYQWILSQIGNLQAASSGFGHGVVVSSYIPYRGIPFKQVAILGMNESVFPRNPSRPMFDLIHKDPRPGDRITKEDDALLFLEVLNSTSEHLYISYIGQDLYSENEKLPSILLQKLMDTAAECGQELTIQKEKLHGFNPYYFTGTQSYSGYRKKLGHAVSSKIVKEPVFYDLDSFEKEKKPHRIHFKELINFFVHSGKYVLQQEFLVDEGYEEGELADRELFDLDGLSKWALNNELLDAYKKRVSEIEAYEFLEKAGKLPEGIPGEKIFQTQSEEVKGFLSRLSEYRTTEPKTMKCSVQIGDKELFGNAGGLIDDYRVIWRMGRSRPKDLVELWITNLILATQNFDYKGSFFITNEKGKIQTIQMDIPENPIGIISQMLDWFKSFNTKREQLALFVNSSFVYAQKIVGGDAEEGALKAAENEWISTERSNGEDSDFYHRLIWKGEEPIYSESFKKYSLLFWKPVFTHTKVETK